MYLKQKIPRDIEVSKFAIYWKLNDMEMRENLM